MTGSLSRHEKRRCVTSWALVTNVRARRSDFAHGLNRKWKSICRSEHDSVVGCGSSMGSWSRPCAAISDLPLLLET